MTEEEAERLAVAIAKALQQARSVSDSQHYDHHVWITERIKREQAWASFWHDLHRHVAKWGAVSLLSIIGYAAYLGAKHAMMRGV